MRYLIIGCVAVLGFAVCGPLENEETPEVLQQVTHVTGPSLTVTHLNAPDGTRVRYLLGLVGCGTMEMGRGEAVIHNGSFELPFDPSAITHERTVQLFLKTGDDFACDLNDDVLALMEVAPTPGSIVDVSQAESQQMGCWLFGNEPAAD